MIPFCIDTNAFLDFEANDARSLKRQLSAIESLWLDKSAILMMANEEIDQFKVLVDELPDNIKRHYKRHFKELLIHRTESRALPVKYRKDGDQYKQANRDLNLILSPNSYWDWILGHADFDEIVLDKRKPSYVCRSENVLSSNAIRNLENRGGVRRTHTAKDNWDTWFKPAFMCDATKNIVVVDRYLMGNMRDWRKTLESGLAKFITYISRLGIKKHITVYSKLPDYKNDATSNDKRECERNNISADKWVENRIESWVENISSFRNRHKGTLTLKLLPDRDFGPEAHQRYIRSGKIKWEMDCGFEIFEEQRHHKNIAIGIKSNTETISECISIEEGLNQSSQRKRKIFKIY